MAARGSLDEKLAPNDFVTDFVWAARAIINQPSVAVVSVALWSLPSVLTIQSRFATHFKAGFVAVCLFVCLFGLGWDGVERTFFLHQREGKRVSFSELLESVPRFVGRFLRLGLLVGIVTFPAMLVAIHLAHRFSTEASRAAAQRLALVPIIVALDFVLTFVPPALVFTTRSAREALRIGRAMIRQTWPRSALYVLCPPLALNLLNTIYSTHVPAALRLWTSAALGLLALLAKGAIAAFYLRESPPTGQTPAAG
jgi:hypothetical protein